MTYEFIEIEKVQTSDSGKTHVFEVTNRRSGDLLGTIRWRSSWRQYVYVPARGTVYSAGCLRDIVDFIERAR